MSIQTFGMNSEIVDLPIRNRYVDVLKLHPVAKKYKTVCNFVFVEIAFLKFVSLRWIWGCTFVNRKLKQFSDILSVAKYSLASSNSSSLRRLFVAPDVSLLSTHFLTHIRFDSSSSSSISSKIADAINCTVLFNFFFFL